MKLPLAEEIAKALCENAQQELKKEQTILKNVHPKHAKSLKKLRKAFTQAEVAHAYCNQDEKKKRKAKIKKLNKFTDPCGSLNDKIRQNVSFAVVAQKAHSNFLLLKNKHVEMKGCSQPELIRRMEESKKWFVKKSTKTKISDNTFHMIRFYLRQLMYIHKIIAKKKLVNDEQNLEEHTECWKKLEDVSENMGEMHDDLIDGKRNRCTLTDKMWKVIQWYSHLNYS